MEETPDARSSVVLYFRYVILYSYICRVIRGHSVSHGSRTCSPIILVAHEAKLHDELTICYDAKE
jgi:hypothetical protein